MREKERKKLEHSISFYTTMGQYKSPFREIKLPHKGEGKHQQMNKYYISNS